MKIEVEILGVHQFYNLQTNTQDNHLVMNIMGEEVRVPCTDDQLVRWVEVTAAANTPAAPAPAPAPVSSFSGGGTGYARGGFEEFDPPEEELDPTLYKDGAVIWQGPEVVGPSLQSPPASQPAPTGMLGVDLDDLPDDDAAEPPRLEPDPTSTQQRLKGIEARLGARPYQKHKTDQASKHAALRAQAAQSPIRKPQPTPTPTAPSRQRKAAPVNTNDMFGAQG